MDVTIKLQQRYGFLGQNIIEALVEHGSLVTVDSGTILIREGQYVKVVPLVLEGIVKVFTRTEDKELLLYYIQPSESCVMSFAASLGDEPSKIVAVAEESTILMLMPVDKLRKWVNEHPRINLLFFNQYNQRYTELIETINQLLFNRLDGRVYNYLKEKARLKGERILEMRHRQIAQDLGTAREVISRVMKRLEQEGKLRQADGKIEIF